MVVSEDGQETRAQWNRPGSVSPFLGLLSTDPVFRFPWYITSPDVTTCSFGFIFPEKTSITGNICPSLRNGPSGDVHPAQLPQAGSNPLALSTEMSTGLPRKPLWPA